MPKEKKDGFRKGIISTFEIIVPEIVTSKVASDETWLQFLLYFDDLDPVSRGKLQLFIKVLNLLSIILNFKSYNKLSIETRNRFLKKIENFPIGLIAAGFFGLRTLILMAFYTRKSTWKKIGYKGPLVNRKLA